MLIHHTDCGMLTFSDDDFAQQLEDQTGQRPPSGPRDRFRISRTMSVNRSGWSRRAPSSPARTRVRGFVYDVRTGRLAEVG